MKDKLFLSPEQPTSIILEQLSYAEDILECHRPDTDLVELIKHVLEIALLHQEERVRCEALDVLSAGFVNHSEVRIDLTQLGQRLSTLSGEELLTAIHVIGTTGDGSYVNYVRPFLDHQDVSVRAEATDSLQNLGVL